MMTLEKYIENDRANKSPEDFASHLKWLNSYRADWMTDDQWLLSLFLCRLFKGFHHCPEIKQSNCGQRNIVINTRTCYFSNYDYDYLTMAVIMSHNWGVRLQISGSGPGMFKISLWKRHKREGDMSERMPTIEDMVDKYKDY
jgi:hypothetical protein